MPTPKKGPRLASSPAHERLMLANMATSLFQNGQITTTLPKAKRLRPLAERLITFAKRGDLHSRRRWNPAWLYSRLWPMLLLAIWFVRWSVPRSRLVRGAKRWNGLRTRWPIRCERGQAGQSHRKG